jgi:hypothetical protein
MFTSLLRRGVPAVVAVGSAAAAVLVLAAPVGASIGARHTSPEQAGYTADHAQFKEVFANIHLRDPAQYAGIVARYGHGIQLWSADRVVSLSFTASTSGHTYIPNVTIYNRSTHQVIASDPNAKHRPYRQEDWSPGVGGPWGADRYWTSLSIGYSPATGHLQMMVEDGPTLRDEIMWSYDLPGQSFTKARIGTSFGSSPWDATYTYTPPAEPVKAAAYTQVRLTSYSGHTDGLSSWWMRHKLLAQPYSRGLVAIPHNLTSKGHDFRTWFVPKNPQSSS